MKTECRHFTIIAKIIFKKTGKTRPLSFIVCAQGDSGISNKMDYLTKKCNLVENQLSALIV